MCVMNLGPRPDWRRSRRHPLVASPGGGHGPLAGRVASVAQVPGSSLRIGGCRRDARTRDWQRPGDRHRALRRGRGSSAALDQCRSRQTTARSWRHHRAGVSRHSRSVWGDSVTSAHPDEAMEPSGSVSGTRYTRGRGRFSRRSRGSSDGGLGRGMRVWPGILGQASACDQPRACRASTLATLTSPTMVSQVLRPRGYEPNSPGLIDCR
jgi:hypothetical protein